MREDVKEFLKNFEIPEELQPDELVLIAQVVRIVGLVGSTRTSKDYAAVDVFPDCSTCESSGLDECIHTRIISLAKGGGQQCVMRLKRSKH